MNRLLMTIGLTFALFAGTAAAGTALVVTDDGVDYTDADLSTAYLSLSVDVDGVHVAIDDVATEGALAAIAFDVPDLGRTDLLGDTYGALLSDVDDVTIVREGSAVVALGVTHGSAGLDDVAAGYVGALEREGLAVTSETGANGNFVTVTGSGPDGTLTVRLRGVGGDVTAYIWAS